MSAPARARALLTERGGAVVLAAAAAYALLAAHHVGGGDNAEFATLGAVGGVAHPSGYPLYVLWLRALAWLPGSPAHAAALATALLAIAQLAALHAACRAWGARAAGASLAVALYAAAPVTLRLATEAEVFTLNGLAVACVLWLAAAGGPLHGGRRALALGLVAGLGLANHMTCALVAPIGLLGVVRGAREAHRPAAAALLACGGLLLGLAPYLYLFVAPAGEASWGQVRTLGDLLDIVLRRDYGGPTGLAADRAGAPLGASEWALARSLLRAWWLAPGLLGAATLGLRCVRAARAPDLAVEPRAGWCALVASVLLAGPLLVARFNLPPTSVFLAITERFYALPALLLAIPVAVGLAPMTARLRPALGAGLAITAFAGALAPALPRLAVARSAIVEDGIHNLLGGLPPDAVLIVSPDDLVFGARYAQLAEGLRPDVHVVAWHLMPVAGYRARQAAAGFVAPPGPGPESVRFAEAVLATGRPLVVDTLEAEITAALPSYPVGGLVRVLARGAPLPSLDAQLAENRALFLERYVLAPTPDADSDWAAEAYARYARTWAELGERLEAAGRREDAGHAYGLASQLHPGEPAD